MTYALVRRLPRPGTVQTHGTQLSNDIGVQTLGAFVARPPRYGLGYLAGTVKVGDPPELAQRVLTVVDAATDIAIGKITSDPVTGAWRHDYVNPNRLYHVRVDDEPGGIYESDFSSNRTPEPMP